MPHDLEQMLTRELRDVAAGIDVPPRPALPEEPAPRRVWPSLLAAAAVVVALAAVGAFLRLGDERDVQPAPAPSPTVTEAPDPRSVPTTAPRIPWLVDDRMFVDGKQVPGEWAFVEGVDDGWLGGKTDGSYWWGYDAVPRRLEGRMEQPPAISPSGHLIARSVARYLVATDTGPVDAGFDGPRVPDLDDWGGDPYVSAVTDDGLVVVTDGRRSLLWRAEGDSGIVDLTDTAPDQVVLDGTAAGLVATDTSEGAVDATQGEPYLATIDESGALTRLRDLPLHDDLVASARWLAWAPAGTLGGEVSGVRELRVERVDGGDAGVLTAPEGWVFRPSTWAFEDDDFLVASVVDGEGGHALVRCSPALEECVFPADE